MTTQYDDRPYMNAQTVALIKPDGVQRGLIGPIIARVQSEMIQILRMRLLRPNVDFAIPGTWNPRKFYAEQHEGEPYYEDLVRFMCSGPSVALLLKGEDIIKRWRKMMGPFRIEQRIPGTIRSDFMIAGPGMHNLVHGSDSPESFVWEYSCLEDV